MNKNYWRLIYVAAFGIMLCGLLWVQPPVAATSRVEATSGALPAVSPYEPVAIIQRIAASTQGERVEVVEYGDPDAPGETLVYDPLVVQNALDDSHALYAFPSEKRKYKNAKKFALTMLDYALEYADRNPPVSRRNTPEQIRKIVSLFFPPNLKDPFCAMGIAWVASKAYCDIGPQRISYSHTNEAKTFKNVLPLINRYYFPPSASCFAMQQEAMKRLPSQRGSWMARGKGLPKRGFLVLFDWKNKKGERKRDGIPDHVGIVRGVDARNPDTLYTVEFNTSTTQGNQSNGGAVAKKVRSIRRDVIGFIRTYTENPRSGGRRD